MMTNTELLAIAKKQLGNGGSKYRKYVGADGNYCNMFVYWLFNANGCASLLPFPKTNYGRTYCPSSIKWCRKNLAEIPPYIAMACDIIYMDWEPNGIPNHIGIVDHKVSTTAIATIEGNTSGGIVAAKTRNTRYTNIFRPHFKGTYKKVPLVVDGDMGYQTIGAFQVVLGISADTILGIATVKKAQAWAGAKQDGAWGVGTSKKLQSKMAKEGYYTGKIDGAFGEQSVRGLQKIVNAKLFTVKTTPKPAPKPASKPVSKPATQTRTKMSKIGHARKDYDGKAGDSSGKEVCKTKFTYNPSNGSVYDWTYVFRPKDIAKAEKAAVMCEKAIANNNIGYCSKGETKYGKARAMTKLAKAAKYDLSKIKVKCGCSCGDLICLCNHWAGLSTCYIGSGKQLAESYRKNSNFQTIKYSKGMQLYRGDVLITAHANGKHNHVVMCL